MAKKEKCPECPPKGAPAYMTTFGDLMSLLLTFFVLLISMASFETAKFKIAAESLQGAFGVLETFPTVAVQPFVRIPKHDGDEAKRKMSVKDAQKIKQVIEAKKMDEAVKVEVTEKGIAILLRDPVGFASGSSDLKKQGQEILTDISSIIKSNKDLKIRVEGHTDDVPIHNARFNSNWELSSARSLSVVQLLAQRTGINPSNMSAVGYGEYKPLVPNINRDNRAKNRRIQIFVDYLDTEK